MVVGGNCLNCDLWDCGRNGELSEAGFTGFMGFTGLGVGNRSSLLPLAVGGQRSKDRSQTKSLWYKEAYRERLRHAGRAYYF